MGIHITIHRGAYQIGGCITEIATDGCKVLIDFGSNLPENNEAELPQKEIDRITKDVDAIFYTHYHNDHIGLHHLASSDIPQYIGKGAKEIMICKYQALCQDGLCQMVQKMQTYDAAHTIDVANKGKIKITPYFVSHSAFDAYMFLIECKGISILHTGDFRNHGYLGKGLFPTLKKYIGEVDILITEGTMLGRQTEKVISERDIENNVINVLRSHKYVFALCSSTDMERLASFHTASKATDHLFCVDNYQNNVLKIFSKYAGKKASLFNFDKVYLLNDIYEPSTIDQLQTKGFLMPVRMSSYKLVQYLLQRFKKENPVLIYSMWDGYAQAGKDYSNEHIINIRKLFGEHIFDGSRQGFHTSGHANVKTLQEVCKLTNPRICVIPIHKDISTRYESLPKVQDYQIVTSSQSIGDVQVTIR